MNAPETAPRRAAGLKKYKWAAAIAAIALFLFYWYEVRPIRIYRGCATQASADARVLLKSKAELAKGTEKGNAYGVLIGKNMYLRSDYESFLNKCLLYYGLTLPNGDVQPAPAPSSAAASSKAAQ